MIAIKLNDTKSHTHTLITLLTPAGRCRLANDQRACLFRVSDVQPNAVPANPYHKHIVAYSAATTTTHVNMLAHRCGVVSCGALDDGNGTRTHETTQL